MWLLVLSFLVPLSATAEEQCQKYGVVFGFFNGVQTTLTIAGEARRKLEDSYGPTTPEGEAISYQLFYNDTQGFADFVETFDQRLQEHGGLLAGRFELFFSAARGEGVWWKVLTSAIPSLMQFLDDLFDLSRAALMRELTASLGDPNMGEVVARHQEQIDQWAGQGKKMLFFAHSQGNLFVNRAYTHATNKTGGSGIEVVHVGPASPTLSGAYTLADKDIVINALRLVGSVVPNTTEIPAFLSRPPGLNGHRDLAGHGLLEIYLNPALPTAERIRDQVLTALGKLDSLQQQTSPQDGASHRLDSVIFQSSTAWVWRRTTGREDEDIYFSSESQGIDGDTYIGWERVTYNGKGVDGFQLCETDHFTVPEWGVGTYHFMHCNFSRRPLSFSKGREPDELKAYRPLQDGEVVKLTKETYTDVALHPWTESGIPFLSFDSRKDMDTWGYGIDPFTYGALGSQYYWTEPYQGAGTVTGSGCP